MLRFDKYPMASNSCLRMEAIFFYDSVSFNCLTESTTFLLGMYRLPLLQYSNTKYIWFWSAKYPYILQICS